MAGGHLLSFGLLADELTESESTRRVFLTAGGMILLGVALLIGTVWWWRATRPDHPVLAPLEVMSERRWTKLDPQQRQRLVDESRPPGRLPEVATIAEPEPEPVDLSVLVASAPPTPDDLAEIDILLGLAPDPRKVAVPVVDGVAAAVVDAPAAEPAEDDVVEETVVATVPEADGLPHDELPHDELPSGDDEVIDPLLQRTSKD